MIDGSIDGDFAALERSESLKKAAGSVTPRASRGVLATLPARPETPAPVLQVEASAIESVPVPEPAPDPIGHLQTARFAFVTVIVLILYLVGRRIAP